jgi:hypothetical protein
MEYLSLGNWELGIFIDRRPTRSSLRIQRMQRMQRIQRIQRMQRMQRIQRI